MKKLSQDNSGIWVAGVVLAGAILFLIVLIGIDVLRKDTSPSTSSNNQTSQNDSSSEESKTTNNSGDKTLELAETVSFRVPHNWFTDGIGCTSSSTAFRKQQYEDSVRILPGERLPTKYRNGSEPFAINVCVFSNANNLSAKDWALTSSSGGIGLGQPGSEDTVSAAAINGHDSFYLKQVSADYHEVHYALIAHGKIIYVQARTYEPGTIGDNQQVGDFRKFESSIADLVKTITIKSE